MVEPGTSGDPAASGELAPLDEAPSLDEAPCMGEPTSRNAAVTGDSLLDGYVRRSDVLEMSAE